MAVAAQLVVLLGAVALFAYAGLSMKALHEDHDRQILQRGIDSGLARLRREVQSATVRNEAYDRTTVTFDSAWADKEIGQYYNRYLKHDATLAFGPDGAILYASRAGAVIPATAIRPLAEAVQPMVARVRRTERARLAASPTALGFERAGHAEGAVRAAGRVYLASASSITPEVGYRKALPAERSVVVVSVIELTPARIAGLGQDFALRSPRLLSSPPRGAAWVSLRDADGRPVSAIAWTSARPGLKVLMRARWTILAVALLLMVVATALVLGVRRLSADLLIARDDAHAADRAKSAFIANTSHEVRTPLNGILGMAQVMAMDDLHPIQRRRLDVIREAGASLLAILNDVLDMSKIQAGKIELEGASFDVADLARKTCAAFGGLALAKALDLELKVEPRAAGGWVGDPMRLRQVISNLLSNALKFTETGSVVVLIDQQDGELVISVTDTGIGLAPEELPRLFGKFSQAEASTTRRFGGTGLGLSICLHLVELMGGRIEVESRKSRGSRFTVSLPLARAEGTAAPVEDTALDRSDEVLAPPVLDRALRILAAEDNATNQLVLKSLLEPLDVSLTMTANGVEAVEAFKAGAFDLVLMDAQMPQMNGADAARAIRAFEKANGRPRTPILALSANVLAHQVETYLAAGMDGHIPKPIDIGDLYAAIDQAIAPPPPAAEVA